MARGSDGSAGLAAARMAAVGFLAGVAAGALLWSDQMRRSRRNLFSRSAVRRFLALGHVGGETSLEHAVLLREYLAWERRPLLRRRAQFALRRMEHHLDL
jgi:hypothetical protein